MEPTVLRVRTATLGTMLIALAGATDLPALQDGPMKLSELVQRLELNRTGAPMWLEKLAVGIKDRRRVERLLLVDRAGNTLLEEIGDRVHVPVTSRATALLDREGAGIVLVHNHRESAGLSGGDLLYLVKRGLAAIAAVGHDGSVYVAAAGPRYGAHRFLRDQYRVACTEIDRRLSFYLNKTLDVSWRLSVHVPFAHLVSSALERASVIEYRADLSPSTRTAYARVAAECDQAIAAAVRVLTGSHRAGPVHPVPPADDLCGGDPSVK